MKAMPFPFEEFQGNKGFPLDRFSSSLSSDWPLSKWAKGGSENCYVGREPTSVLDARRSPSPPTSSSATNNDAVAVLAADEECGHAATAMEDWESVLSESSPPHHNNNSSSHNGDQSILRLIMADVDDPSLNLNRLLHHPNADSDSDFGLLDSLDLPPFPPHPHILTPPQIAIAPGPALLPLGFHHHHQAQLVSPPPAKRLNTGGHFSYALQQEQQQQQGQLSYHNQQPPPQQQQQQAIAEQLSKAAELIETGTNLVLAQGILARLNHQLTPLGITPLHRASLYFTEALQCLLGASLSSSSSPFGLILRIGAHKAFSEVSPLLQFANFTSNQAILDATHGFSRIHVVDFDIGYGGQWASLMQEVALRSPPVSLKITAFAPSHDQFELAFTHDNLKHFAADLGLSFDLQVLSLDALTSASWPSAAEAVAVNLPVAAFSGAAAPLLPLALRFAKQLVPKVLVALERGADRPDAPFPAQVAHGVGAYTALLESLDAVNAGPDTTQKIEQCLVQPAIERLVLGGAAAGGRRERAVPPWRSLLAGVGFAPMSFSNFAESQAECLVQRTPARGFHVEKRQSSLVLCWQRKDLVSVSAWRC